MLHPRWQALILCLFISDPICYNDHKTATCSAPGKIRLQTCLRECNPSCRCLQPCFHTSCFAWLAPQGKAVWRSPSLRFSYVEMTEQMSTPLSQETNSRWQWRIMPSRGRSGSISRDLGSVIFWRSQVNVPGSTKRCFDCESGPWWHSSQVGYFALSESWWRFVHLKCVV